MAWAYSLIENPGIAEAFLYKALDDTHGRCAPALKREVRAKKGLVEKARRLATLHTSSDWDRITRKGIVQTICGRMLSLIPVEGTKAIGAGAAADARRLTDYQKFAEVVANDHSARYKVLIEVVMFRCGYQAPDVVEKLFRNHPTLRTAAQIGTPIAVRILKAVASGGMGIGAESAGAGGNSIGADILGGGADNLVGGLIDQVSERAVSTAGIAGQVKGVKAAGAIPLASSQAAHGHRAVICELEDPHSQDPLGTAGLGIRHRIAVFQVTPLRYTQTPGSNTRMVSAFNKSVIGVRTFVDTSVGKATGFETGVAGLNYMKWYEGAEKQPFITSMSTVEAGSMNAWMEAPTYFLRDAEVSTATQVERLGTNPGANVFHGDYVQWKSSAAVRAITTAT